MRNLQRGRHADRVAGLTRSYQCRALTSSVFCRSILGRIRNRRILPCNIQSRAYSAGQTAFRFSLKGGTHSMSTRTDPAHWLEEVIIIAIEAGRLILDVYERQFDVSNKDDGSPLTDADRAAHEVIAARLAALTPGIPILSEESAKIEYSERAGWQRFWLVDPLDGTKEFVNRNREVTVNIAVMHNGAPVLGVECRSPVLFSPGRPARAVGGGRAVPPRHPTPAPRSRGSADGRNRTSA